LLFWWSYWVIPCSFQSSWVVWLRFFLFFLQFLFNLQALRFCFPLALGYWSVFCLTKGTFYF
jgi:hypothetical protein